ncbi:MAG: HTH domain-containing protein [Deferribacterales bacterium]
MHKGVFDYLIKPIVLDRLQDSLNKYITFFNTIKTKSEVDQKDIDMTIKNINIDKDDIPKGIDEITLKKILKVLEGASDYLTADEIGDKIGASRNTARRYLEYLMEINVVEVNTNYGKIGRTEREFILVSKKSKNNKM